LVPSDNTVSITLEAFATSSHQHEAVKPKHAHFICGILLWECIA